MPSVALIGPDGAGKTTIARMLERSSLLPFKYLYMGIDIEASNIALPTSRLVEYAKKRIASMHSGSPRERDARLPSREGARRSRGRLWAVARLANRVAEECFRHLVSYWYQMRGYVVLYDRHFVFDFAEELNTELHEAFSKRLHRWWLRRFYPRPDLVIYLDAPARVLFARKGESTVEDLERRRQAFIHLGKQMPHFVQVDGTQPLDKVYTEVVAHILRFCGNRHGCHSRDPRPDGLRPTAQQRNT